MSYDETFPIDGRRPSFSNSKKENKKYPYKPRKKENELDKPKLKISPYKEQ